MAYIFTLYVVGGTQASQGLATNLEELFSDALPGEYVLHVVDVIRNPEKALANRILATPTLVLDSPPPERRVMGNLRNRESLFFGLNLPLNPSSETR